MNLRNISVPNGIASNGCKQAKAKSHRNLKPNPTKSFQTKSIVDVSYWRPCIETYIALSLKDRWTSHSELSIKHGNACQILPEIQEQCCWRWRGSVLEVTEEVDGTLELFPLGSASEIRENHAVAFEYILKIFKSTVKLTGELTRKTGGRSRWHWGES